MRGPTGNVAELIAKNPALQRLQRMNDKILFLAGGLPIEISGEVVGGIGVGGAKTGDAQVRDTEQFIFLARRVGYTTDDWQAETRHLRTDIEQHMKLTKAFFERMFGAL